MSNLVLFQVRLQTQPLPMLGQPLYFLELCPSFVGSALYQFKKILKSYLSNSRFGCRPSPYRQLEKNLCIQVPWIVSGKLLPKKAQKDFTKVKNDWVFDCKISLVVLKVSKKYLGYVLKLKRCKWILLNLFEISETEIAHCELTKNIALLLLDIRHKKRVLIEISSDFWSYPRRKFRCQAEIEFCLIVEEMIRTI